MGRVIKKGAPGRVTPPSGPAFRLEIPTAPAEPEAFEEIHASPVDEAAEAAPDPEEIARQIVARAEAQARSILDAARNQAVQIGENARKEGLAAGKAEADAALGAEMQKLEERSAALMAEREAFYEQAERELVGLSIEIARKVLKQELKQNPDVVLGVVRETLRRVKDKDVVVRVNPQDVELVREHTESFRDVTSQGLAMDVAGDRRVGPGGCIIETQDGNLDARLESQMEVIEEQFTREGQEQGNGDHAES